MLAKYLFGCGLALAAVFPSHSAQAHHIRQLYGFGGGDDGAYPVGGLIMDTKGNLYGTTEYGGSGCSDSTCGVVFQLASDGTETVLHTFTGGSDGLIPAAGLIRDSNGNLYSTTYKGGAANKGTA